MLRPTAVLSTDHIRSLQSLTRRRAMSTLTFLKYCGAGFGEDRPLESGQKYGAVRDMERTVAWYRALRTEIKELRWEKMLIF